jgi:hypothetical protein
MALSFTAGSERGETQNAWMEQTAGGTTMKQKLTMLESRVVDQDEYIQRQEDHIVTLEADSVRLVLFVFKIVLKIDQRCLYTRRVSWS